MKKNIFLKTVLGQLAVGGQTVADVEINETHKKAFVWGGLPDEEVEIEIYKKRAGICEAIVSKVLVPSPFRVEPRDYLSYLSTSPWQIYDFNYELEQKKNLIKQSFAQNHLSLDDLEIVSDACEYNYRNKMEFAWWWNNQTEKLDFANYKRGSKGKIAVSGSSLAMEVINQTALKIRDLLNNYQYQARSLKTLLIRANQNNQVVAQIYVVDKDIKITQQDFANLGILGLEIIYSNPKSPASVNDGYLQSYGVNYLTDKILGIDFHYAVDGFFQINLGVYELALKEIKKEITDKLPILDLYSGVGTIGLTVADNKHLTMVESNPKAVEEMKRNVDYLDRKETTKCLLADSEKVLEQIKANVQLIVDPPRVGLHHKVVERILEVLPSKIVYLSCNPATQARDAALLSFKYQISRSKAFNFFPKTPHIENLLVLKLKSNNLN